MLLAGRACAATPFTGMVEDNATGMIIAGAKVVFTDTSGMYFQTFTDANGAYSVLLMPGVFSLRVEASGYPLQYYNPLNNTETSNFRFAYDSVSAPSVTIKLTQNPTAIISSHGWVTGLVTDTLGLPLANVNVCLVMTPGTDVTADLFTDTNGRFSARVPAVQHALWAMGGRQAYPKQYWTPGGTTSAIGTSAMFGVLPNDTFNMLMKMRILQGPLPVAPQPGGFLAGIFAWPALPDSQTPSFEIALFPDSAFLHQPVSVPAYLYETATAPAASFSTQSFVSTVCPVGQWRVLMRPIQPALYLFANQKFVQCRSYILGALAGAALLSASPPVAVIAGDTTKGLAANFTANGYAFLGTVQFADTSRPSGRVDACIKDGAYLIPVSHGFINQGDSVFELSGLIEGTPYVIVAQADGYPMQYWSPGAATSAQPNGTYVFSSQSFVRPVIKLQKAPTGYYVNYSPLSVSLSPDQSNRLIVQANADASLSFDSLSIYSKDRSGVVTLLSTIPKVSGQNQYAFTDTRDWQSNGYEYMAVAKGSAYTARSMPTGLGMGMSPNSPDSLWLNVYGDHFGIMINWAKAQSDSVDNQDSLYLYKQITSGAWSVAQKMSALNTMFSDNTFNRAADSGKTFSYKIALVRAGITMWSSSVRQFAVSAAFLKQLAVHFAVGPNATYTTIQQAIDAAGMYDEIDVASGVYMENINLKGKFLTINGNWIGNVPPVIDGQGSVAITIPYRGPVGPNDGASISGMEIRNALTGVASGMNLQVQQCLFVNVAKQCCAATFDSAAMTAAAQADPFCSYNVSLNLWQCTFVGTASAGAVAIAASQGTYETSSAYGGLEPFLMKPAASFATNAMANNSIMYGFSTAPLSVSGKAGAASVSSCDFWNAAFDSSSLPGVKVSGGLYKIDPMFANLTYYFLPDSSPLYSIAVNGMTIGYDDRRKMSSNGTSVAGPSAVQNLRATVMGPRAILVTWNRLPAAQNAASYVVYRAPGVDSLFYVNAQTSQWTLKVPDSLTYTVVDTVSTRDTFFTDTNVRPGVPYVYAVAGRTATGVTGNVNMPFPPPLAAYIIQIQNPSMVAAVSGSPLNFTSAYLAWPHAALARSYTVYRYLTNPNQFASAPDSGAVRSMIHNRQYASLDSFQIRDTSLVDSSMALGRDYVYVISAADSNGLNYSLDDQPLAFSFVSNNVKRFTPVVPLHIVGGSWNMIGPWGTRALQFSGSSNIAIYQWDDSRQPDDLFSQYAPATDMNAGSGYWFYADSDTTISIPADTGTYSALAQSQGSASIRLHKDLTGWNQVSSVFPFAVTPPWLSSFDVYEWDNTLNQYTLTTQIVPWKAYWIQSDKDTVLPLSGLSVPGAALSKKTSGVQWELQASLAGPKSNDPDNYCGVASQSIPLARPKPPQAFSFPELYFVAAPSGPRLAKLYVGASVPGSTRYEWTVGLSSAKENMTIRFQGVNAVPKGNYVYWIQNGLAYDLRKLAQVPVAAHKSTQYGYIVVTQNAGDVALYTGKFELRKTYPNPFASSANIEFFVPYGFEASGAKLEGAQRSVSLDVYNIAGRRVKSLARGSMDVGLHRLQWNGTNDGGATAATGFYIVRLAGKGVSSITRMIKVR